MYVVMNFYQKNEHNLIWVHLFTGNSSITPSNNETHWPTAKVCARKIRNIFIKLNLQQGHTVPYRQKP